MRTAQLPCAHDDRTGLMERKDAALIALTVWLLVVAGFAVLARSIDLEVYFVLALIGLLVIVELIDPAYARPSHIRRVRYLIAVGVIIFGAIVVRKVMEILAS